MHRQLDPVVQDGTTVLRSDWGTLPTNHILRVYRCDGSGHGVPGYNPPALTRLAVGASTKNLDAMKAIWEFLQEIVQSRASFGGTGRQ